MLRWYFKVGLPPSICFWCFSCVHNQKCSSEKPLLAYLKSFFSCRYQAEASPSMPSTHNNNNTPETNTATLEVVKTLETLTAPPLKVETFFFKESIALLLHVKAQCLDGTRALRTRTCPPSAPFNYCPRVCSPLGEEPSITAQRQPQSER